MGDLSKFGVPLDGQKLGMLQPKQKFKFSVTFTNFGDNSGNRVMTQNVVSCTRPKQSVESVPLHSYNSVANIAGKHTWEPINLVVRDDITNGVISAIGSQMQKTINHFEQTSAASGINYKFTMEIRSLLGGNDDAVEYWQLDGCWLENISHPDGDYSDSGESTVELTIRYDNATQIAGAFTNGGTTVGGNPMPNLPSPNGGTLVG